MPKGNPGVPKTPEHNEKNAAAHRGKKRPGIALTMQGNTRTLGKHWSNPHSEDWKSNQSRKMLGNRNWRTFPRTPTKIELALRDILSIFLNVEFYKIFGRFEVDAYVPELHAAFEADGSYWHKDEEKESLRDNYLKEEFGLLVIHVREGELLSWLK